MSNLRLNKEIFDIQAIEKAIDDYKDLALISIVDSQFYVEVVFLSCKYEKKQTSAEFENYVIDIMNTKEW